MPCIPFKDATGKVIGIACTRGGRSKPCRVCGGEAGRLCDGPGMAPGKTCDAPLCRKHARVFLVAGKKLDFCPSCTEAHLARVKASTPAGGGRG